VERRGHRHRLCSLGSRRTRSTRPSSTLSSSAPSPIESERSTTRTTNPYIRRSTLSGMSGWLMAASAARTEST